MSIGRIGDSSPSVDFPDSDYASPDVSEVGDVGGGSMDVEPAAPAPLQIGGWNGGPDAFESDPVQSFGSVSPSAPDTGGSDAVDSPGGFFDGSTDALSGAGQDTLGEEFFDSGATVQPQVDQPAFTDSPSYDTSLLDQSGAVDSTEAPPADDLASFDASPNYDTSLLDQSTADATESTAAAAEGETAVEAGGEHESLVDKTAEAVDTSTKVFGAGARVAEVTSEATKELAGLAKDLGVEVKTLEGAEKFLESSAGKTLEKVLKRGDLAGQGLGALATTYTQYRDSTATTTAGKVVDTVGGVAADWAFGKANPIVAGADALTGGNISKTLSGSVRSIVTVGEALVTGNDTGLANFHERSKAGQYGAVMQAASEAGDYWAQNGVVGGLKNAWNTFTSGW
jgi:hypothetical protein